MRQIGQSRQIRVLLCSLCFVKVALFADKFLLPREFSRARLTAERDPVERPDLSRRFAAARFAYHTLGEMACLQQNKLVVQKRQSLRRYSGDIALLRGDILIRLIVNVEHRVLHAPLPV